ncbi:MAG: hypothetical protein H6Q89_4931 [Myxococcaceae bacterium]|nr:hypothetical protein [Myxococcaceae bacterium]
MFGHGHATRWRGLCRALAARGHRVWFFERAAPSSTVHRGPTALALYPAWEDVLPFATRTLADADAAIVTSSCADGFAASRLVLSSSSAVRVFYDLGTPGCLRGDGLGGFDVVLSDTGGRALEDLRSRWGARIAVPLYSSVDPLVHRPRRPLASFRSDLSYVGTFARDRQRALEELFVGAARRQPRRKFILAGEQYPPGFLGQDNIFHFDRLPPSRHPALYSSSRLTLNVTRGPRASIGFCPSARLFEAAACGVPLVSDRWEGMGQFFTPGSEILLASTAEETLQAMELSDRELRQIAEAARERTLQEHTAERRAEELERILEAIATRSAPVTTEAPFAADL